MAEQTESINVGEFGMMRIMTHIALLYDLLSIETLKHMHDADNFGYEL
jgi:hypothetical protein